MISKNLYLALISLFFSGLTFGQTPGDLDTTFNHTGKVKLQPGTLHDVIYGMDVQTDSKIVFCGVARITATSGFTSDLVVGRLNTDGSIDSSFGNNGYYNLPGQGGSAFGYNVKIQPDGKIVVCGGWSLTASDVEFIAIRLNTDGTLDNTFGNGTGYSIIPVGTSEDYAYDLRILNNGKIILAGSSKVPGFTYKRGVIMRLNADGAVDTTFGNQGMTLFQLSASSSETFKCMDITAGGSIIAAGYSYQSNTEYFVMAGFSEDGLLNTSFATNGSYFGTMGYGYDLAINGNVVYAGGKNTSTMGNDITIMSFDTLGVVNTSWGLNGIVAADYNPIDICLGIIVQPDGKLLVGGTSGQGALGARDFIALRYNPNGTLDPAFGNGGYIIHQVGNSFSDANAISLQPDGKILLGGFGAFTNNDMVIMRLHNDLSTGISEVNNSLSEWSVYPVPVSNNELNLICGNQNCGDIANITIVDLAGREIMSVNNKSELMGSVIKLNLPADLGSGVYLIRIESLSDTTLQKFIKH